MAELSKKLKSQKPPGRKIDFISCNEKFIFLNWKDTDFRQQRLRAWEPVMTPNRVIAMFLVFGESILEFEFLVLFFFQKGSALSQPGLI